MKILTTALAAILLCTFLSCNRDHKQLSALKKKADEAELEKLPYKTDGNQTGYVADSTAQQDPIDQKDKKQPVVSKPIPNPDWDKKIIKTASLNLEVKDYNASYTSFREKLRNLGGYVAQEEQNQSDYKIETSLVIKVPVDQFDNAIAQFTSNAEKINERKISSDDVTGEFVDTKSRMESKKQVLLRYMDLLKQAKNMEEILNVQSEINGIQEEIEAAAGRINYLGHSSAFSTINLTYYQVLNSSAKNNDDSPSFGTKFSSAFKTGWRWITDLFIGLVAVWPLFLVIGLVIIFYKRIKIKNAKA